MKETCKYTQSHLTRIDVTMEIADAPLACAVSKKKRQYAQFFAYFGDRLKQQQQKQNV